MSTEYEIALPGGTHGPVVRVSDTVRRQPRSSTQAGHAPLRYLDSKGFEGAPKALGFDEQGREVLSLVPGDVVGQRGNGISQEYIRLFDTLAGVA
jgi:hypothetical protein